MVDVKSALKLSDRPTVVGGVGGVAAMGVVHGALAVVGFGPIGIIAGKPMLHPF